MTQIAKLLLMAMIIMVSCRSNTGNKAKPFSAARMSGTADSGSLTKQEADNYIIDNSVSQENGPVYMYCEKMPEFPGGEKEFVDYMRKNVKYPQGAVSDKIQGRVVIKFIIRETGKIGDIQLVKSIRKDLDDECVRVIRGMPGWKPGSIKEKPVSVSYSFPVRFLLTKTENLNGIYILPSTK
jgi:TonB family protein